MLYAYHLTFSESAAVQVDEAGEKVRPNPRSGVLILREIPESTPLKVSFV